MYKLIALLFAFSIACKTTAQVSICNGIVVNIDSVSQQFFLGQVNDVPLDIIRNIKTVSLNRNDITINGFVIGGCNPGSYMEYNNTSNKLCSQALRYIARLKVGDKIWFESFKFSTEQGVQFTCKDLRWGIKVIE